jgi:TonB family protein
MQATASAGRNVGFGVSWVGQSVDGRFPLQKYLGGSRTSAVFLTQIGGAEGAKAVIKLLAVNACDPEAQLEMWRTAGRLSHPHLIRIFDGGRCWLAGNDLLFVVMEHADENLGEVLPRRALSAAEGDTMLRPILEALKYLHRQGLAHGHLRPSNVMAANDQLKISTDGLRPVGEIKGPFEASIYDAPELKAGKISPASDVWSLGATLTEALTPKTTAQNGAYTGLPKPFAEIVHHCLLDEPTARWALTDIENRLKTQTTEQQPTKPEVSAAEIRPHVRRFLPLALAAILLAIILAIYGLVRGGPPAQPAPAQPAAAAPAQKAKVTASAGSPAQPSLAKPSAQPSTSASPSGAVLQEVPPNASRSALRTIHGRLKVRVRVGVDSAGNVSTANLANPGPSKYFARLALQAAQQWKFTPPRENGQPVSSQWTILFEFTRGGISQQANLESR